MDGGGWMGWGWVYEGVSHACMHAHIHVHTHTHTYMLNMINMDGSMLAAICMHAYVHVWGYPHDQNLPPPQSHRETKTPKFNKS